MTSHLSMTGFGRAQTSNQNYSVIVEMKSVNNRFKDAKFKMPHIFNPYEIELRARLFEVFNRGSFDVFVQYEKGAQSTSQFELDYEKVTKYLSSIKKVTDDLDLNMSVQATEFLRSEFYFDHDTLKDELKELLLESFEKSIKELKDSRQVEGKKLIIRLNEHKNKFTEYFKNVEKLKGTYQEGLREKFLRQFDSAKVPIDEQRLSGELIYYLEKLDIEEEITRIYVHLEKLASILRSSPGGCGRQVDFLVQELNRETNTIGSKCASDSISENIIEMKVQLEKIREQALNLE